MSKEATYSIFASSSNLLTCSLASRTARFDAISALSASRSAASARETCSLAARMDGSSFFRLWPNREWLWWREEEGEVDDDE